MLSVHADRDLVAHGPGRNKQRGFAAKNLGRACFQLVYGGVFAVDVVPHLGRGHGGSHGSRGTSDRIAAQVDRSGRLPSGRLGPRQRPGRHCFLHTHCIWSSCSSTSRKRAKTSLEKSRPRRVSRTTPSSSVSSSSWHRSRTTGRKGSTRSLPNSAARSCHATPARRRKPRNQASSNSS